MNWGKNCELCALGYGICVLTMMNDSCEKVSDRD